MLFCFKQNKIDNIGLLSIENCSLLFFYSRAMYNFNSCVHLIIYHAFFTLENKIYLEKQKFIKVLSKFGYHVENFSLSLCFSNVKKFLFKWDILQSNLSSKRDVYLWWLWNKCCNQWMEVHINLFKKKHSEGNCMQCPDPSRVLHLPAV